MSFTSIDYIVFLAIVWGAYALLPRRGQNAMLLVASYCFYGAWDWKFLSLILLSTLVDYSAGLFMRSGSDRTRRAALICSMVSNLGLLGVFKYFGFFVDSAVAALDSVGIDVGQRTLEIVLPVGISFYTFQTMSYTIDVYRRRMEPTRDLLDFSLFVAFFPQLVAGPIERASHLLPALQARRVMTTDQISRGLFLILLGLAKKLAVADGLAGVVDAVYGSDRTPSGIDVTVATYAFAFQILCDFSAYTDIARGTSKLFGIDLLRNFDAPYFARSPSDFWRRWHISLSSWLRDYLYIPLGGNRGGPLRTYRNLMLTMGLGGLWHGAAWNFVLWGLYQGVVLCLFRLVQGPVKERSGRDAERRGLLGRLLRVAWITVGIALFFQVTCYGWLLFRCGSVEQIVTLSRALLDIGALARGDWLSLSVPRPPLSALLGVVFVIVWEWLTFRFGTEAFYRRWPAVLRGAVAGILVILLAMGLSNDASTFIYFQF